ncbi:MAG: hypothetical protein H7338_02875 [Candidatus Sericytochromatia bacterium]|nr:hypothetical protein [Candidatus Sericytochromatia bacterium]
MSNIRRLVGLGVLLVGLGCSGTPSREAVLLVGRGVNPHWSTILSPALAAPDREITVVDVAKQSAAVALKPWLVRQQRLIVVPLVVSEADPLVAALRTAIATRAASTVVAPPGADDLMATGIAARALRLSQRRSQEGLFVLMDLPPGADPKAAQATVDALAIKVGHAVDFRVTTGIVWQGEATASDVATRAAAMGRPLIVTYTTQPGPISMDLRTHLHGFRYALDGEGILSDSYYSDWLRAAVGQAAITVATQPVPK